MSPLPPARPRQDPVPDPPPAPTTGWLRRAEPEHVGPAAGDPVRVGAPGETRLAASKNRKQKRWRVLGRSAVAVAAAASVGITGVAWGYLRNTDNGFSQVAALDLDSTDVVDPGGQTGDETYLIVGTDTRAGANGGVGAGSVEDAEGARADTVILVNIPADRSRVVAVSFPRDLDIARPSCADWNSDTGQYSTEMNPPADNDKLNSAYAFGGPKCLVKVIQKMSGLKIGHFVAMDFSGFESMVNQVGGVEVCTTTPLIDGELGTVLPNAGKQTIDGATALNYVRARKVEAEGNGDYGRIKRQQMFLSSLLRGALSNKVLFDPGKLNGFINAFTRDTFVQNIDTKSLVMLGRSLQNVDAGAVTFLTVPTAGTNELGNEIPRQDDIDAIFQAIIDDEPLPGEERKDPAPSSAQSARSPPRPHRLRSRRSARWTSRCRCPTDRVSPGSPPPPPTISARTDSRSTASGTTPVPARTRWSASRPGSRRRPRRWPPRCPARCCRSPPISAASSRWCSGRASREPSPSPSPSAPR
ncbi:cell envelope-related function transcriptional attenuator common domain protein [Rhodococcus sp. MTM3W5.2]|nr:cell envelope-related function transcriptional attenuator common domain protein [Rhodococcus sp. MTM3W5.2]